MRVGILEHAIEILEPLAKLAGALGREQVVEDRLVVLIHQDHDALAVQAVDLVDQLAKPAGNGDVVEGYGMACGFGLQQLVDVLVQGVTAADDAIGEAQADDRVLNSPVPLVVDEQTVKQGFAALEEAAQGVHQ